ncbi:MAG TPA: hypothetical protein VGE72_28720 [Azospirillum sp.]
MNSWVWGPYLQFPSGNVSQNGWLDHLNWFSPTINVGAAGDPQLEVRITREIASYGRQLGTILDALEVLRRHANLSAATPDDLEKLKKLDGLHAAVGYMKENAQK